MVCERDRYAHIDNWIDPSPKLVARNSNKLKLIKNVYLWVCIIPPVIQTIISKIFNFPLTFSQLI